MSCGGSDKGNETSFGTSDSESASASETGGPTSTQGEADSTGAEDESTGTIKFDAGLMPDLPLDCDGGGDLEFSYIWVANSGEGTISKIDTITLTEEGRYRVRPDSAGSPSRTSVSLGGDVAVANRMGGITKVFARPGDCVESNGMPGIQTSTGANDVLDWGVEECVAWHTPMSYFTQRPIAWTQGVLNESTCRYDDTKVWSSGAQNAQQGTLDVVRLNGDDGTVEDIVNIPEIQPGSLGAYGGAVDGDGNFWFTMNGMNELVRTDYDTLEYTIYDMPISGYGMTVDYKGRPWMCGTGVARFDPVSETFDSVLHYDGNGDPQKYAGCMAEPNGMLWLAGDWSVRGVDLETMDLVQTHPLPEYVHGISIDFAGNVFGVEGIYAWRVDPVGGNWDVYDGLTNAYSYSDMTGFALLHAGAAG